LLRRPLLALAVAAAAGCGGERDADVLVPFGARWRIADTSQEEPAVWAGLGFDDAAWLEGPAPIGFGDGDERTLLSHDLASGDDDWVTLLRHGFRVDDPSRIEGLRIRVIHDDGAVVFLNGRELFRSNVRGVPLSPQFPAATTLAGEWERRVLEFWPPPEALRPGRNVIAAQVHQHWRDRSDLRFDLELAAVTAEHPLRILRGPWLQSASPSRITVRWRTNRPTPSRLLIGPAAQRLDREMGSPGPTREHEVVIGDLEPDTRYAYTIVDAAGVRLAGGDGEHVFTTPPPPGSRGPLRIWALGDSGTADDNARAVRDGFLDFAAERSPDVWLLLGDNAYPTGSDGDHQAAVFEMYPQLLRRWPVWPVLGNHGANLTDTRTETGPFYDIWSNPTGGEAGGPPSGNEAYYAIDRANVRLVAVDSAGSRFGQNSPMMRWLGRALDAPDADWVIVYLHHPPISGGTHEEDPERRTGRFQVNLMQRLEAADVDLVLAGHSHAYERSKLLGPSGGDPERLAQSVLDDGDGDPEGDGAYGKNGAGTVFVVAGSGGQVGHEGRLEHPAMAVSLRQLGSFVIDIEGCRLDGRFVGVDGGVADRFRLEKCAPPD
jgi:hypothetical protein